MKTITLLRRELVWQTRSNTWNAENWRDYKDKLERRIIKYADDNTQYIISIKLLYNCIKEISWDEVVAEYAHYEQTGELKIVWSVEYDNYILKTSLIEVVQEAMRDNNYDADICDIDYADDYEEDFYVKGE